MTPTKHRGNKIRVKLAIKDRDSFSGHAALLKKEKWSRMGNAEKLKTIRFDTKITLSEILIQIPSN